MLTLALIASVLGGLGPQTRIWGSDQNPGAFLEAGAQLSADGAWEKTASTYDFAPGPRKQLDEETGLTYFGARYYDSRRVRWISPDAAALNIVADGNPIGLSTYAYGNNNPIAFVDPDGNAALPVIIVGGGILLQRAAMSPLGQRAGQFLARYGSQFGRWVSTTARAGYNAATRAANTQGGQEAAEAVFETVTGGDSGGVSSVPTPSPSKVADTVKAVASEVAEGGRRFFRGAKTGEAPDFTPRPNEFKVDPATGTVKPTHGVSVFDNPQSVSSKGFVPHEVDQATVPGTLQIKQRGADPAHYEIMPADGAKLTPEQFKAACQGIECMK